jgi:hypothetical protein
MLRMQQWPSRLVALKWGQANSLTKFDTISLSLMDDNIKIDAENKQDKRLWTRFTLSRIEIGGSPL